MQLHFLLIIIIKNLKRGITKITWGFLGGSVVTNLPASARDVGDPGSIPGSGRSPGEGNGNPLRYACLENSTDRGAGRLQSMGSQSQT